MYDINAFMYDLYLFVQSLFICHFALGRKEKKHAPPYDQRKRCLLHDDLTSICY